MGINLKLVIWAILVFFIALAVVSAAHYITGIVNDAYDGTSANGYEIVLWNPANGIDDNLTDIIGVNGNSGSDNIYFIDCELLNIPCDIGDEIRVKVMNNGSDYITGEANVSVTGAGYDVMPSLRLNSKPNATLISPIDNANISSAEVNFSCRANDLDGNLKNATLYGNWSWGWHANESVSISGSEENSSFGKELTEGTYEWSCLVSDELGISRAASENFTFSLDLTPPNISSMGLNLTGDICGIGQYVRVNCTTSDSFLGISSVIIETISNSGRANHTAQFLLGDTYFYDVLINETGVWNFNCIANDSAGNTANLTSLEYIRVHSDSADLSITAEHIAFSELSPVENQEIVINATVINDGCSEANNFDIGFFEGDPDAGGIQINGNKTISILALGNKTVNVSWSASIGTTNIFILADLNNTIAEENESNNKANNSIYVNAWQDFYGNVSIDKLLANSDARNLSAWYNESSIAGNIFIVDKESDINWNNLLAIGKNLTGGNTTNDFSEIDSILNMNGLSDSVANRFSIDGNNPLGLADFLVRQQIIENVPVINSTNNTNFITGILWDGSDSSDGEFNATEKEDLVFVTKINKGAQGKYGTYDYEITIPGRLREYYDADINEVFIYYDLN